MVINWMQTGNLDAPTDPPKVRAAQYVRMSTEHQKYSTDNQAEAIRLYAERRGYRPLPGSAGATSGIQACSLVWFLTCMHAR